MEKDFYIVFSITVLFISIISYFIHKKRYNAYLQGLAEGLDGKVVLISESVLGGIKAKFAKISVVSLIQGGRDFLIAPYLNNKRFVACNSGGLGLAFVSNPSIGLSIISVSINNFQENIDVQYLKRKSIFAGQENIPEADLLKINSEEEAFEKYIGKKTFIDLVKCFNFKNFDPDVRLSIHNDRILLSIAKQKVSVEECEKSISFLNNIVNNFETI